VTALQCVCFGTIADAAEQIDFIPQRVHSLQMIGAAEGFHISS
jgi:hypothetical protein